MRPPQRTPSEISKTKAEFNNNYWIIAYYLFKIIPSLKTSFVVLAIFLAKSSPIFSSWNQRAKKVVSDSPELVDFAIGQVKSFEEFKSQKNCEINSAHQNIFRLVEMTFGLVYASFSLPKWLSCTMELFCQRELMFHHLVFTTKTIQPRPQVFSVNCSIIWQFATPLTSSVHISQNSSKFGQQ